MYSKYLPISCELYSAKRYFDNLELVILDVVLMDLSLTKQQGLVVDLRH